MIDCEKVCMKVYMMLWIRIFFTVATFTMIKTKVIERDIITSKKRAFLQTSDVGLSPRGRSSYLFKVKSCDTAIITLSNIKYIEKTKGRYFLFYLGRNFNTQLSLLDSCFGCPPKAVLRRKVLDCNAFVTFWMQWNDLGSVWFGAGHRVGHGILLSYTTPRPFSIRYSQVTTLAPPTAWKFLLDEDVRFLAPASDGSTRVFVRENVAVGSFVYEITVRPLVNTILTSSNDHFMIFGTKILTKTPLDFESKRVHFLHLRTTEGEVNTTLTVIIEDVNDEVPEIHVISDVRIPEELPIGFLFSGCFVVSDKDHGDNLIFKLEGADTIYLDVTRYGQLQVKARIDRDGPKGIVRLDNLTLVVEDTSNHTTKRHLYIDILDVDDNVPTCSPEKASVTIYPNMTKDIHVCGVKCSDLDLAYGETFHLRLDRKDDIGHAFFISGTEVYVDADFLRQTFTKNINLTLVLKLVVVTVSETIEETSSSFTIIIKVRLEHPVPDAFAPYWISPISFANRRFFDMEISETTPRGTLIRCLLAYDLDEMSLSYHIATISTDDGNQANDVFKMDAETGCIRTATILDADRATGGVYFYDITVKVTDEEHVLSAIFRVILKNVNDNPPIFKKTIHHASINSKKHLNPLAEFDVTDFDEDSEISLTLERGHHHFFKLTSSGGRWKLMLRPNIDSLISIPSVVRITAKDNWSSQRSSQVVVIMEGLPCQADLAEPKRQIGSDIKINHSTTEVVSTSDQSTTPMFDTKSSQLDMTQSVLTYPQQEFESTDESPKPAICRLFLTFVCVCLAVCNGLILALLMVVLGCRDRPLPKEESKTKEQDEASREIKHSRETRGTIETRPRREANVVCLLNIQEETRKVKFRNIKIIRRDAHDLQNSSITQRYDPPKQAAVSHIAMGDIEKDTSKASSFESKDIGIQTYPDENGYKGKHSTLHYMQKGPEASFNEIESVEVMKRHMNVKESFLQLNPFEVKTNHVNVTPDDEHFGANALYVDVTSVETFEANANYVDVTSDEETLKENAKYANVTSEDELPNAIYFPVISDDDSAHSVEESPNGVHNLSNRPSVINLKGNTCFDVDDDLVTDGLESVDFDHYDNVYDVLKTGCEDIGEESSDKYSTRQSLHEDNQTSAAERSFAISNINVCRCSQNDLDISQVFRSKQDVECSALSSKMFRSLLHQDRESKVVEEDILEVNSDFLKSVVVSQGGRVSDMERSLKRFPKKHIRYFTIVYLPRVIFLSFLSQRLKYCCSVESSCDVVEIHSHFLHTSVAELEKHTLAVCRAKGTVFAMRHITMTFLCQNYRLIEVSVDFLTQLGKSERQAYRFIDDNIVAVISSKDGFLVLLDRFLQFAGAISSVTFPDGHMGGQCCQQGHTLRSEYTCREIRHHGNIGFVSKGLCRNSYKDETFQDLYSTSSFGSSEHNMTFCSYSPSYHSTLKGRTIGRPKMSSSLYSMDTNTHEIVRSHLRKFPDDVQTFPHLGKSTPSRKKTRKQCHSTGATCTTVTPTTEKKLFQAKPAKTLKKKSKVKAWNKEVRDRLYGKANTIKTDKSKCKVSPES